MRVSRMVCRPFSFQATLWQDGPGGNNDGYWKAWKEFIGQDEPVITPCLATLEHNWPPV